MWGTEQWGLVAIGGLATYIASVFYMWGGTAGFGLVWRRWIGSFVVALAANLIAVALHVWVWQYLLFYPMLGAGMTLGYGSSRLWVKVLKRTLFALGVLSCCIVGAWIAGFSGPAWIVLGLAFVTGLTSVVLGVWNPFSNAPLEQYIIANLLLLYVPFWSFVR